MNFAHLGREPTWAKFHNNTKKITILTTNYLIMFFIFVLFCITAALGRKI